MSGAINLTKEFLEEHPEFATMSDFKIKQIMDYFYSIKSKKGGEATKAKFGPDYFKNIRKRVGKTATKSL